MLHIRYGSEQDAQAQSGVWISIQEAAEGKCVYALLGFVDGPSSIFASASITRVAQMSALSVSSGIPLLARVHAQLALKGSAFRFAIAPLSASSSVVVISSAVFRVSCLRLARASRSRCHFAMFRLYWHACWPQVAAGGMKPLQALRLCGSRAAQMAAVGNRLPKQLPHRWDVRHLSKMSEQSKETGAPWIVVPVVDLLCEFPHSCPSCGRRIQETCSAVAGSPAARWFS